MSEPSPILLPCCEATVLITHSPSHQGCLCHGSRGSRKVSKHHLPAPTHLTPFISALGLSATQTLKLEDLEGVKDSQPHSRLPLSLRRGESHRFITHHHNPNLVFCWKLFNGSCAEPTPPFPNRMWFCSCNHHPFPSRIQLPHRQPVPLFPSPLLISDPKVPPRCSGPPYLTRVTSQGRGSCATHQHSCPG